MSVDVPVYDVHHQNQSDQADIYPYGFAATSGELDDAVDATGRDCCRICCGWRRWKKPPSCWPQEIEKTRRRVNALEYVMIPQLQDNHPVYHHEAGRKRTGQPIPADEGEGHDGGAEHQSPAGPGRSCLSGKRKWTNSKAWYTIKIKSGPLFRKGPNRKGRSFPW